MRAVPGSPSVRRRGFQRPLAGGIYRVTRSSALVLLPIVAVLGMSIVFPPSHGLVIQLKLLSSDVDSLLEIY